MTVTKLSSGGLFVLFPVIRSPALRREVHALGPAHELVSPFFCISFFPENGSQATWTRASTRRLRPQRLSRADTRYFPTLSPIDDSARTASRGRGRARPGKV